MCFLMFFLWITWPVASLDSSNDRILVIFNMAAGQPCLSLDQVSVNISRHYQKESWGDTSPLSGANQKWSLATSIPLLVNGHWISLVHWRKKQCSIFKMPNQEALDPHQTDLYEESCNKKYLLGLEFSSGHGKQMANRQLDMVIAISPLFFKPGDIYVHQSEIRNTVTWEMSKKY